MLENLPVLPEENLFLIDWLSFTLKSFDVQTVKDSVLCIDSTWEDLGHGFYGYPKALYFGGISILYGASDEMGVCVQLSGQGCRSFESYSRIDWNALFNSLLSYSGSGLCNVTRLDIAFDDHSGILDLDTLKADTEENLIVSKFRKWDIEYGSDGSMCIYHGSRKSDILFRIYNKAIERGFDNVHWVRLEMQLRNSLAFSFLEAMYHSDIGSVFVGVVRNYLRYVTPSDDLNKSRWPMAPYWDALIGDAAALRLWSSPGVDYNMSHLENFVLNHCGNALRTYTKIAGFPRLAAQLDDLDKDLPPKYKRLLNEFNINY